MSDGVGLDEAGGEFFPLVGFNRDLVTQQSSGFRCTKIKSFVFPTRMFQESVDGGGGNLFESFNNRQIKSPGKMRQPRRDDSQ